MAAIGRGPLLFRSWTRELGYINFQSWGTSAPLLYPGDFVRRLPNVSPRIIPVGSVGLLTWTNPLNLNLQDNFFGSPGQPPANLDWPNPRGYVPASDLRTWVQSRVISKDSEFGLAGVPNFDWPNPRGYIPVIDLKTHVDQLKLNLQGQDAFFSGAGNAPTYDYPNPRGYPYPHWLVSWTDALKINLSGQDKFFGASGQAPANLDWPIPKGYVPSIDLRTWTWSNTRFIGQDLFPDGVGGGNNYDWPVPRGYVGATDLRTWLNQSNFSLIITQVPFLPLDFPNPR